MEHCLYLPQDLEKQNSCFVIYLSDSSTDCRHHNFVATASATTKMVMTRKRILVARLSPLSTGNAQHNEIHQNHFT